MDRIFTRDDLLRSGMSVTAIASAVHAGDLIRVRRGRYARRDCDPQVVRAARVGGVLGCVSELRRHGVWILGDDRLHVRVPSNAARLRQPDDRASRLPSGDRDRVTVHWAHPSAARDAASAIVEAAFCLPPRAFQAALDSSVRIGVVSLAEVDRIRPRLPAAVSAMRVDPSAESGLESIVRSILIDLGFRVVPQVVFPGVGRVDLLVEGCVVVELDGDAFHDAVVSTRDRRRDARLIVTGRAVLRFRYAQVVFETRAVILAIIAAVRQHRAIRNSGRLADSALRRLERVGLS